MVKFKLALWFLVILSHRGLWLLGAQSQEGLTVEQMFEEYNRQLWYFKRSEALVAWNLSMHISPKLLDENKMLSTKRNEWNSQWCSQFLSIYGQKDSPLWTPEQSRQLYLICKGPGFNSHQLGEIQSILGAMQTLYNQKICLAEKCFKMEPDLNRFMETTRDEEKLKSAWIAWHEKIGTEVKPLYVNLIHLLNQGAREAGYKDMGDCWRQENEIPNLEILANKLYSEVSHLFTLLHSFVRFKLERFYNLQLNNGPIPAHLLGNMWAQKWDSLIDIVWPETDEPNIEKHTLVQSLLPPNATVINMVEEAESFFMSMGFPALPLTFWENSYFEDPNIQNESSTEMGDGDDSIKPNCHGSAANMFGWPIPDYRMMVCAKVNDEDLITIHHEMGHIMYFMAYRHQPTVFQDGANSAFHESVGDSITYGLKTDEKMKRSMKDLLKIGLAKLPQIGFGLVMDKWRWEIFQKENSVATWNDLWWELNYQYLGLGMPSGYFENGKRLDAAGKFHIIDNIPYIRYFMASFLQMQFYESMCHEAGWRDLHKCQLRGSKRAGQLLWRMMSKGSSKNWKLVLREMTGSMEIKADSLLKYFLPLKIWLEDQIALNNLTVGWHRYETKRK